MCHTAGGGPLFFLGLFTRPVAAGTLFRLYLLADRWFALVRQTGAVEHLYGGSPGASVMKLVGRAQRDSPPWHQGSMVVCNLGATEGGCPAPAVFLGEDYPLEKDVHWVSDQYSSSSFIL